jgi:hypothetical protein
MLIPILLILISFFCLSGIFFILETRQIILSFSSFSVKSQINPQNNNRKQVFFRQTIDQAKTPKERWTFILLGLIKLFKAL